MLTAFKNHCTPGKIAEGAVAGASVGALTLHPIPVAIGAGVGALYPVYKAFSEYYNQQQNAAAPIPAAPEAAPAAVPLPVAHPIPPARVSR